MNNFTKKDLIKISRNRNIINLLKKCEEKKFIKLFDIFKVKTSDNLISLVNSDEYDHIKVILKHNTTDDLLYFYNLLKFNDRKKYNIYIGNNKNKQGVCNENEKNNLDILNKKNNNYLSIYYKNKYIGIIKRGGEKTFLSFEDIFDKNGKIIFLKGYIYNLEIDGAKIGNTNYIKNKKIDLSLINYSITRNPLRKIKENFNATLYNNFDLLVLNFCK